MPSTSSAGAHDVVDAAVAVGRALVAIVSTPGAALRFVRGRGRCHDPEMGGCEGAARGKEFRDEHRYQCPDDGRRRCSSTADRKSTRLNSSHVSISYAV